MEIMELKELNTGLIKIELNSKGDYIEVSIYDPGVFERFTAGARHISCLASKAQGKIERVEKKYRNRQDADSTAEMVLKEIGIKADFSNEAVTVIDGIFGEGTIKKYFRDLYEEVPGFTPDVECLTDFLEQITPVMEALSNMRTET